MRLFRLPRRAIARLGPYPSLILVGVPLAIVEPLKLATVFIAGEGHWITGLVTIIVAYAVSLFVTERLFKIVKPKLLTLPWFAALWRWFVAARRKVLDAITPRLRGLVSYPAPRAQAAKRRRYAPPPRQRHRA